MKRAYKTRPLPCLVSGLALLCGAAAAHAGGADERLNGVWMMEGYGRIMEVKDGNIKTFQVTEVSCVLDEQSPLDHYLRQINRIDLTERDRLRFYEEGGITRYDNTRLAELPDNCTDVPNQDPEYNFEIFWRAFQENYAFFDLYDVDWDAIYRTYRPQVTQDTTPEELFDIMTKLIKLLKDGHVNLTGLGSWINAGKPGTLEVLFQEAHPGEEVTEERLIGAAKDVIARHYLKDSRRQASNGNQFTWGWAADGIGYLSVDSMSGYLADNKSLEESLRFVDSLMRRVMADLDGAEAFIIDARWNSGGSDANALAIAAYFTDQYLLAFTKKAKNGDGYNPAQGIFIPNHPERRFAGPVVYLCSSDTFSAAEIFSMAMQAIPNVTSMGERTGGALSDKLGFDLPNGWRISMSNEVYIASDGELYEGRGIPVDITLPKDDRTRFESHLRLGMDRAIAYLNKKR